LSEPESMPQVAEMCEDLLCVAECHIQSDVQSYPAALEDGAAYVTGDFWTVLTTPDIADAYRYGHLKGIGRIAWYQGGQPFTRWVDTLYRDRLDARTQKRYLRELTCKLFLNSLSGKFAQRSHRWEFADDTPAIMPWGQWCRKRFGDNTIEYLRSLNWNVQERCDCGESRESVPALYAHITAYARRHMRTLIGIAGVENCYYMDTDSLHVNVLGLTNLNFKSKIHSTKLGYLRSDGDCGDAHYYGLRDYRFGGRYVFGGLSMESRSGGRRDVEQWVQDRLPSTLNGTPGDNVRVRLVRRQLSDCHVKGEVMSDGKVKPYRIKEDYTAFRSRLASARGRDYHPGNRQDVCSLPGCPKLPAAN
jgi:hypothetical protein